MSDDLKIDAGIADELAANLTNVDLSGAVLIPYPATMNIGGAISGVSLGNSLYTIFNQLNALIAGKAEYLPQIAQILIQADAQVAAGI